jgi:hypothetical protein
MDIARVFFILSTPEYPSKNKWLFSGVRVVHIIQLHNLLVYFVECCDIRHDVRPVRYQDLDVNLFLSLSFLWLARALVGVLMSFILSPNKLVFAI